MSEETRASSVHCVKLDDEDGAVYHIDGYPITNFIEVTHANGVIHVDNQQTTHCELGGMPEEQSISGTADDMRELVNDLQDAIEEAEEYERQMTLKTRKPSDGVKALAVKIAGMANSNNRHEVVMLLHREIGDKV